MGEDQWEIQNKQPLLQRELEQRGFCLRFQLSVYHEYARFKDNSEQLYELRCC